jgi:hypothetical protein
MFALGGGVGMSGAREGQILEIEAGKVSAKSELALRKRKLPQA